MIPAFQCPPDGPIVNIEPQTGEKYADCYACRRCGGCARGAFVPELDFRAVM
jgi:hypothetical protein